MKGKLSGMQSGRAARQNEAFDLGRAEYCRGGEQRGEWNEELLAVIYSGKNGAVILSYKLESFYF